MPKKRLEGQVVSARKNKTVVVKVIFFKRHPKYFKQYSVSRRFKAHDESNEYSVGDVVEIEEVRPMSKEKNWLVIRKIK